MEPPSREGAKMGQPGRGQPKIGHVVPPLVSYIVFHSAHGLEIRPYLGLVEHPAVFRCDLVFHGPAHVVR